MRFMGWDVRQLRECPLSYVRAITDLMAEMAREADGNRG